MDVFKIAIGLALAVTWQSVLEYYWHRAMHLPAVYAKLHKFHHHYKSPQPWDDLFIHPLESFGYCLILYSPAFCVPNLPVIIVPELYVHHGCVRDTGPLRSAHPGTFIL